MKSLQRITMLAFWLVLTGILTGCPGPERTECQVCDQVWCEGNTVVTCECYDNYPNGGYGKRIQSLDDCSLSGTTCSASGTAMSQPDAGAFGAQCLALCPTPGVAECRNGADWFVCADPSASVGQRQEAVEAFLETGMGSEPTDGEAPIWLDANLACTQCNSDCGCDLGQTCQQGFCLFEANALAITCCGRERTQPCPNGDACENADGSAGTCETVGECEFCQRDADCATGECYSHQGNAQACHPPGFVCIPGEPEIEVSPTLLNFGDVMAGTSGVLTVSLGNLGTAPLQVTSVALDPMSPAASSFTVEPMVTTVAVDQIVDITVTFAPATALGMVSERLVIQSDDADEPSVTVLINANAVP